MIHFRLIFSTNDLTISNEELPFDFESKFKIAVKVEKAPQKYLEGKNNKYGTWFVGEAGLIPTEENVKGVL
jgi:hypothetical protein